MSHQPTSFLKIKCLYIDNELDYNKTGIGRDAIFITNELSRLVKICQIAWLPVGFMSKRIRRKILQFVSMLKKDLLLLPNKYSEYFYQSHIGAYAPNFNNKLWIVRLHDLFPITNPEWFRIWDVRVYKKSLNYAVARGALFLTDSKSTETELKRLFGSASKSLVFPCKVQKLEEKQCFKCCGCQNISQSKTPYILAVGTVEPRKNYQNLVYWWSEHRNRETAKLVIIGKPGWRTKELLRNLRLNTDNSLVYIDNCCDGSLNIFYKNARAFISLSYAEGFDLPAMEARQLYQLPIVLSDIPVHREFHEGEARFIATKSEFLDINFFKLKKTQKSDYLDIQDYHNELRDFLTNNLHSTLKKND
jgi:glycosyltransferase involved in cell wall biosynthesis